MNTFTPERSQSPPPSRGSVIVYVCSRMGSHTGVCSQYELMLPNQVNAELSPSPPVGLESGAHP